MDPLKPSPPLAIQGRTPPPESHDAPEADRGAVDLWGGVMALVSRATDSVYRVYVNSLDTVIWTRFQSLTYDAPISPWYLTEKHRKLCNPKVVEVFCKVMENYRAAPEKNPHILSYTRYSVALEGEDFDQHCHNALSRSVEQWIGGKTEIQIGKPHAEMEDNRHAISHDFLQAVFPLMPHVTHLTISGPIREEDRPLITQELLKMAHLAELHFELDKESAEYFIGALPEILTNRTIANITFNNFGKKEKFNTIQEETWTALRDQDQCGIAFTNIPEPAEPHNRLAFN